MALHLGAVPDAIEAVLEKYGGSFVPGDIVILNDPYQGGMHLPDIFMFKPIFTGDTLHGFAVVITHHCDMGGRVPGSNAADSTEIFQEGLRIPPLKLYEAGKAQPHPVRHHPQECPGAGPGHRRSSNPRSPPAISASATSRASGALWREALADYFDELIDYGETLTRKAIATWPDGDYTFTDYIDGDGFTRSRSRSPAESPLTAIT